MSGIFGVLGKDGRPASPGLLQAMGQALGHLGPDGIAQWSQGEIGLGYAANAITPESQGETQPHVLPGPGLALVADALLVNRDALCDRLGLPGPQRPALSDARLLALLWERLGEDALAQAEGDFTLAVWDGPNRRLCLAKGALCHNPLYFAETVACFAFASDPRALMLVPGVGKTIDVAAFKRQHLLLGRLVRPEETLFAGIKRLPSAAILTTGRKGTAIRDWWRPEEAKPDRPARFEDCCERVRELFFASLRPRLRSVHPIAALLSGGLDSSSIVAAATQLLRPQGRALILVSSALPADDASGRDERAYIDIAAKAAGLTPHYVTPVPGTLFDRLERGFERTLTPLSSTRHYLYDALADAAGQAGARTILDGCYGEMGPSSHGPEAYPALLLHGKLPSLIRELRLRAALFSQNPWRLSRSLLVAPLLPAGALNRIRQLRGNPTLGWQELCPLRLDPDEAGRFERQLRQGGFDGGGFRIGLSARSGALRFIHHARWAQWGIGGAFGQPRFVFPFLDRRLVEYILTLPSWLRVHNGYPRALIRGAMAGILPEAVRLRTSKAPFSPDYYDRLRDESGAALAILDQCRPGSPAWELVDVPRIRATILALRTRGSFERIGNRDPAKLIVQFGVHAAAFLNWFHTYRPGPVSGAAWSRPQTATVKPSDRPGVA